MIEDLIAQGHWNLVWVSLVVQLGAYFAKQRLKERFSGLLRFAIIYGSTVLLGSIVLLWSGVDWREAFAVSNWLAQAQVAMHQAYKTSKRERK